MKSLSPLQFRLLDAAVQLREAGYEPEKVFVSREMVQATLPHKNPGASFSGQINNYRLTFGGSSYTLESNSVVELVVLN